MRDAKEYTDVSVIHSSFEKKPLTVAFVKVDKDLDDIQKCEVAYKSTNSIDVPWWKGDNVIPTFPIFDKGCRSTSVGDFVLIGNTKYKCASFGWEKV